MTQVCKLTTGPYSGATVLLDVSPGVSGGGFQLGEGGVFSPPPLQLRTADTPLEHGERVLDASYSNRAVDLPLVLPRQIGTTTADTRAAAVTALQEVLARPDFWLEIRPDGASASRWLHCYPPVGQDLDARLRAGSEWADLGLQLEADPFALGAKASTDVTFDAANWGVQSVSAVAGDVPCPVVVQRMGGTAATGFVFLGSRRRELVPATAPGAAVVNGTSGMLGTDASFTSSGDANAYNADRINVSYATRNVLDGGGAFRAGGFPVLAAQTDQRNRGSWRIFARLSASATQTIQLQAFSFPTPVGQLMGPVVTLALGSGYGWYDTGLVLELPKEPAPPSLGYGESTVRQLGGLTVYLDSARVSGSGNTQIDAVMAMPASDRLATMYGHPGTSPATDSTFYDPINLGAWSENSSGGEVLYSTSAPTQWWGGLPLLSATNPTDLWLLQNIAPSGTDPVVRLHYWPRYLTVV